MLVKSRVIQTPSRLWISFVKFVELFVSLALGSFCSLTSKRNSSLYQDSIFKLPVVAKVSLSCMWSQWILIAMVVSAHYCGVFDFLLENPESLEKRQDFLQTSVLRNAMEQRISRLGQFINEAQWRFQLVSWNESTNSQKIRNSKKRLAKKIQQLVRTDARWKAEAGQDEGSDDDTLKDSQNGEGFFLN